MKKLPFALPFSVLLGCSLFFPAHAQSFGDFLKNAAADAARNAVADNVRQAVSGAVDSAARSITQPGAANAPAPAAPAQPVALAAAQARPAAAAVTPGCARVYGKPLAIGARPESYQPETLWPDTACPVSSYKDLKFEKARAAKQAFVEASKLSCSDCEGGYWPDAWGWRSLVENTRGANYVDAFAQLLVALKEGESLSWKGNKYDGKVTATGAHPIGELPCRQFHYVLTEQGRQVAEYDSLLCEYKGPYSSKATWHVEV